MYNNNRYLQMTPNSKKLILICISIIFILLTAQVSSAISASQKESSAENNDDTDENELTLNILRYGPDGSVEHVTVNTELNEDGDLQEQVNKICHKLFENDFEMQNYVKEQTKNTNSSGTPFVSRFGIVSVESSGMGKHVKTKGLFEKLLKIIPLRLRLTRVMVKFCHPTIFCDYSNDATANTTMYPLIRAILGGNVTDNVKGNHTIFVRGFVGFASWIGRQSSSPFDVLPRSLTGIARTVICKRI